MGRVERITDFGAFIEVMPGVDGLLHVSEMATVTVAHAAIATAVRDGKRLPCASHEA